MVIPFEVVSDDSSQDFVKRILFQFSSTSGYDGGVLLQHGCNSLELDVFSCKQLISDQCSVPQNQISANPGLTF